MPIDYDHELNSHTVSGAKAVLERLFAGNAPKRLLDIGCGTGTWLRAALEIGVSEIRGVDGITINNHALVIPRRCLIIADLCYAINLGETFDIVVCLEVAEHLPCDAAPTLIASLAAHSDLILFSAAAPGQVGQHHVNCRWPSYWQALFNRNGYVCDDTFRWEIWENREIEPWYRQNIFLAQHAPDIAGKEPRLRPVIHPDMLEIKGFDTFVVAEGERLDRIEAGSKPIFWYASLLRRALTAKARRRFRRRRCAVLS
jgi:SAM-dependent methyltransferase